jgi:hypothetical protein
LHPGLASRARQKYSCDWGDKMRISCGMTETLKTSPITVRALASVPRPGSYVRATGKFVIQETG